MSDRNAATDGGESDEQPPMAAARYPDGTILYPPHPAGPEGQEPVETVDLSEYQATVITWTTSTATPPGVREPNHLGIVEFDVDGESVRAIGQLTSDGIEIGDSVVPVYTDELRDPDAGIREPESQAWDGYRFEPVG
jgi:Predicted nucleic-acid-binding protein containing a Zn-ribbon